RLDPDQGLVAGAELRIRLLLDPDLAWGLKGDGAHRAEPYRPKGGRAVLADADAGHAEAAATDRVGGLFDPRLQFQLFVEVGRVAVAEGDVLALEQLDEDLYEAAV